MLQSHFQVTCPCCRSCNLKSFYKQDSVPVNSVVVIENRNHALSYPEGDIELFGCEQCGFVNNQHFDPDLVTYDDSYEETQGFSSTFQKYQSDLAEELISTCDIRNKYVVEIGCGKGEFLNAICSLGNNRGLGYDPVFDPIRISLPTNVVVKKTMFDSNESLENADLVCCIMTLEHVFRITELIADIRTSIGDSATKLYFQVPNAERIFNLGAFHDIYYEHCSYFTENSLRQLFSHTGFKVIEISQRYQGQYLGLLAEPTTKADNDIAYRPNYPSQPLATWGANLIQKREAMNNIISESKQNGESIALWGGGSKAVSLLNILNQPTWIDIVIDINPRKHNTFLPGTGHKVVNVDYLINNNIGLLIIMNPIYEIEIQNQISSMNIPLPRILSLN